ncbi:ABC-three component system protein [Deinococcus sp. 6GRE01]|uniref:ABC-three component system protein n=1 Tax=Deinococcus sp. 6GRE01 TaxID=2745873 RepID=UPI001E511DC7|nr:ABC-three component system protein [Deinococcus sp. 6GRE01]MCD0156069.1 hypothetical protein [Deinococcus sp. 6GRE01]
MTGQFAANASMLGYLYQIRYALLLLFEAGQEDPGLQLSLEALDDIAFEKDGLPIELIQTKHHTKVADLTDASSDLWKTLRVWSLDAKANPGSSVRLTFVTTGVAAAGSAVEILRPTGQRNIPAVRQQLTVIANAAGNTELRTSYAAFLALTVPEQDALLQRVMVIDRTQRIHDLPQRIKRFLTYSVAPQYVDDLFERLEGWWAQRAVDLLKLPATARPVIEAAALRNKVINLSHAYSAANLPDHFPAIVEMEESELPSNERVFVAQLRLVLNSETRLRHAIGQYYRAYNQRSKWLEAGLIDDEELDQYAAYLHEEWTLQFLKIQEEMGELEIPDAAVLKRLGLKLFNWANENNWTPIRRDYSNGAYPRGSLHMLANAQRIGWHPKFKEELAQIMARAAGAAS